jgi:hypothetical protein
MDDYSKAQRERDEAISRGCRSESEEANYTFTVCLRLSMRCRRAAWLDTVVRSLSRRSGFAL